MSETRVVIADDHAIVRRGVAASLEQLDCVVVGEAKDGLEAIALCKRLTPELLLLDLSMPHAGANEVIEEVRRWSSDTRILVLTGVANASFLQPVVDAEVNGVVLKDSPIESLEAGIRACRDNEFFLDPELETILSRTDDVLLSRREQQVLGLLLRGNNNAQVAKLLNVSPHTVNNHRSNIMRKLDAHSIVELMSIALRRGLVDPGVVDETNG